MPAHYTKPIIGTGLLTAFATQYKKYIQTE